MTTALLRIWYLGDAELYAVFTLVLLLSLGLDYWFLKRHTKMTTRAALSQSAAWVTLAVAFGGLLWMTEGRPVATQYYSAYLMEYSLSMDNIFVFVLILSHFSISEKHYGRVLFYGILMAIVFRLIFILLGVVLVQRFEWILYVFGAFLVYTGYKILMTDGDEDFDEQSSPMYKLARRYLPLSPDEGGGKMTVRDANGKRLFTRVFLVVAIIGTTDIVFALDSIPAAFGITQHTLAIITSNVLAVIGLRAMFFMLMHAVDRFRYLQQGISFVLMFIGLKMLAGIVNFHLPTELSLAIIVVILGGSVAMSLLIPENNKKTTS